MEFNHRKMIASYPLVKDFSLTFVIPSFPTYHPPPPPPPPPPERALFLLVSTSICVIASVLLFLFLMIFFYLYLTQSRRTLVTPSDTSNRRTDYNESREGDFSGDHHVGRIETDGLHRSEINSITVVGFKKGQGIIDGSDCSVCLNEFEEDESLGLLPKCSHAFHIYCIDTWLLSHKNCPLCRAPIILTEPRHQETETNHQTESVPSNELNREEESSGSRNSIVLPRAQSDLARHCGSDNMETVGRSFSIGGSSALKAEDSDDVATISRRHFYRSFSANFFSSTRRSKNQDPVIPNQMSSVFT